MSEHVTVRSRWVSQVPPCARPQTTAPAVSGRFVTARDSVTSWGPAPSATAAASAASALVRRRPAAGWWRGYIVALVIPAASPGRDPPPSGVPLVGGDRRPYSALAISLRPRRGCR